MTREPWLHPLSQRGRWPWTRKRVDVSLDGHLVALSDDPTALHTARLLAVQHTLRGGSVLWIDSFGATSSRRFCQWLARHAPYSGTNAKPLFAQIRPLPAGHACWSGLAYAPQSRAIPAWGEQEDWAHNFDARAGLSLVERLQGPGLVHVMPPTHGAPEWHYEFLQMVLDDLVLALQARSRMQNKTRLPQLLVALNPCAVALSPEALELAQDAQVRFVGVASGDLVSSTILQSERSLLRQAQTLVLGPLQNASCEHLLGSACGLKVQRLHAAVRAPKLQDQVVEATSHGFARSEPAQAGSLLNYRRIRSDAPRARAAFAGSGA